MPAWIKENPEKPVTEPIREQIAAKAAETAIMGIGHVGAMRMGLVPGGPWPRLGDGPESGPGGKPPRR